MKRFLTIKKKLFLLFVLMIFLITNTITAQSQNIKITDLNLNRKAENLTGDKKKEFPKAENGFLWNSDDAKTKKWRPQGITGLKVNSKEFVIVSWYGRPQFTKDSLTQKATVPTGISMDYQDRGARISIVNITKLAKNPTQPNYRNILLIDQNHKTYHGMQAGGIVAIDGKLHVTDSRKNHGVIRVFDLNKTQYLPEVKAVKNYRYVLIEEYNYKVPIKPSFISFDKDKKQILVGTSSKKPSDITPNLMAWFTPPTANTAVAFTQNISQINIYRLPNKYNKIQGMVSSKDISDQQILWLSTSFEKSARSNFYKMNIDINDSTPTYSNDTPNNIITLTNSSSAKYPPGLGDVYLSKNDQLWLLTEFAYGEGFYTLLNEPKESEKLAKKTRRGVFAIKKVDVLP